MTGQEFYHQIQVWKQSLIDDVISHYRHCNEARGQQAFRRWKDGFTRFLNAHAPREAMSFQKEMQPSPAHGGGWAGEHPYKAFMLWDGDKCIAFLDELAEAALKDQIPDLEEPTERNTQRRAMDEWA